MRVPSADTQLLATSDLIKKGRWSHSDHTSSLDFTIWTTCKKPSTSLLSLTSYNTARFLLLCFVRFFKLYGNCASSRCQRRCDREGSRLSRSASRSPPESNPSSGPGCFRVSSFALAIWAEYCCGCAQMLDWSSWRGRGCERAVGVDRWRCSRRFSPPEHRLWLSHDEMSTRHKDPIR